MQTDMIIAVVVVSDTCSEDPSTDRTGAALLEAIDKAAIAGVTTVKHVPDNREDIQDCLRSLIAEKYNTILTAGGTGFSLRDVTPEAVKPFIEKDAPGIVTAMLKASLDITPLAAMARPVAGVANSSALIVTLPGSPKGALENFNAIAEVLPHAVKLLSGANSRDLHSRRNSDSRSDSVARRRSESSHGRTLSVHASQSPRVLVSSASPLAISTQFHHRSSSGFSSPAGHTASPLTSFSVDNGHHGLGFNNESLLSPIGRNLEVEGHTHDHHHHGNNHDHPPGHTHTCSHGSSNSNGSHMGPKFFGPAYRDRTSPYPLIPFDDAVEIVLRCAPDPVTIDVSLEESLGCVIAKDIVAPVNVPSFRASIVDGYAVFHADFAANSIQDLPVSKVSLASSDLGMLTPRTCVRITTGAPVPYGATAVVPVENTEIAEELDGEEIRVKIVATDIKRGDNIREIGSDIALGTLVLPQNTIISPLGGEVGVLASLGITKVPVYRKPVVGVLSTGDEVIDAGEGLSGSQIWDSNRPMLLANLRSWLGDECAIDLGIVRDELDSLMDKFIDALNSVDVLITSGGVSMGELDLIKPLIKTLGGDIKFGRVLMKPGKPVTFATLPYNKLLIALPGNPVSCVVCLQLFGYPLLMKMMGHSAEDSNKWIKVELKNKVRLDSRPEFQRGTVTITSNGKMVWDSTGFQRSSCIKSMVRANALVRLPASTPDQRSSMQGSKVKARLLCGTTYKIQ